MLTTSSRRSANSVPTCTKIMPRNSRSFFTLGGSELEVESFARYSSASSGGGTVGTLRLGTKGGPNASPSGPLASSDAFLVGASGRAKPGGCAAFVADNGGPNASPRPGGFLETRLSSGLGAAVLFFAAGSGGPKESSSGEGFLELESLREPVEVFRSIVAIAENEEERLLEEEDDEEDEDEEEEEEEEEEQEVGEGASSPVWTTTESVDPLLNTLS